MTKTQYRLFAILFSSVVSLHPASAYPLLSSGVGSINQRVMFYQDHEHSNQYWYMTKVIDPVANLDGSVSTPIVKEGQYLYFAYSGQAKVLQSDLEDFARLKHISVTDISPIPFEKTENAFCMNMDASKVNIQIPHKVGSFLEHVPVSVYTTDPLSIEILTMAFANGSGVNCAVDTYFKGAADEYSVDYDVDMNDVFEKFQANLHGEYWFFEADINAALKKYAQEGSIKVTTFSDQTMQTVSVSPTDPSAKAQETFLGVFELIKNQLFVRKTSIPDTNLTGRGRPFSFRTDYQRSSEHFHMTGHLEQQGVVLESSEIEVRVAPLTRNWR